jgi:hypothetical protein
MGPWSLSESKVFKFTKYVESNKMHFCANLAFFTLATSRVQYGGL